MDPNDLNALVSFGGTAAAASAVVEIIKRALAMSPEHVDRFAPLLSVAAGAGVSAAASITTGSGDLLAAAFTGCFAGASAAGLYDVAHDRMSL